MKSLALAAMLSICCSGLCAEPVGTGLRQHHQLERIAAGYRSGALDRRELGGLLMEQRSIARSRRIARADGRVTPGERAYLRLRQNRASGHIFSHKHDRQERI